MTRPRSSGDRPDPVLLSVLAHRMDGIVREMSNTLLRSGRSAVLNTARDFSCSLVTPANELLASAEGLPIHVIGTEFMTEAMTDLHADLREGDAFLHNDPYLGNSHAADHTILVPIFVGGEHVLTACAKAHQADCGNARPTTYSVAARDVYEEGALLFPCVRIQRDYADAADLIRMCRRRIRVPEQWYGDYLATLGAARIGERRILDTCREYGVTEFREFCEEWLNYSERSMAAAIGALQTTTLEGATVHDHFPGLPDDGLPLMVQIRIDSVAGRITVDLRNNADNCPCGLNQSRATATAAATAGVFSALSVDVPHNGGSFRRIGVELREGCVAGIPSFPHSCSVATTNIADRIICMIQTAFAARGDGHGLAEGAYGQSPAKAVIFGREGRRQGRPFVNQLVIGGGGGPGSSTADGWPTYQRPVVGGLMYHDSVEIDEQKYPIHVFERRLIADSGGPGRRRGGLGSKVTFAPTSGSMTVTYAVEGHDHPPAGVQGGHPGAPATAWRVSAAGRRVHVPLVGAVDLVPGERIVSITNGGGGYGDPRNREPRLVLDDVVEGWVSRKEARRVYGVVIRGRSVDVEATALLRRSELVESRRLARGRRGKEKPSAS